MAIIEVDCSVWNMISDFARKPISDKNEIEIIMPDDCLGFKERNSNKEYPVIDSGCLVCDHFFKNKKVESKKFDSIPLVYLAIPLAKEAKQ